MVFVIGFFVACVIIAIPPLRYAAMGIIMVVALLIGGVVSLEQYLEATAKPEPKPKEITYTPQQIAAFCASSNVYDRTMCAAIRADKP